MSDWRQKAVAVFGANDPAEGSAAYETARAVGSVLAGLGYAVANGGYGGTMEATARGAREAGGRTIGVTCTSWSTPVNRYIDRCVQTNGLQERIAALVELAGGGFVVLPGATGTLLELATVWEWTAKGLMAARPVVCVGAFWRPLLEIMAAARPRSRRSVALVEGADELSRHFPPVGEA